MTRVAVLASGWMCLLAAAAIAADAPSPNCGMSVSDWCPAPAGDPCGVHKDKDTCRADPACFGMPYRGESLIACIRDERGFASNCPTVGCTSVAPKK
jgi:hypothetical protein